MKTDCLKCGYYDGGARCKIRDSTISESAGECTAFDGLIELDENV